MVKPMLVALVAVVIMACGAAAGPTATPTKAPTPSATATATPAPTATATPAPKEERPLEWNVIMAEDPGVADPHVDQGTLAQDQIQQHVMQPLFAIGAIPGTGQFGLVLNVLETWEFTDPSTVIMKIRPGTKFHNGQELTAEYVSFEFNDRIAKKLRNYQYAQAVGEITAIDKYTLKVALRSPGLSAFIELERLYIPAPAYYDMPVEQFAVKPIGTGPYRAIEYPRDQPIKLEAWDAYPKGKPFPPRLTIRYIPEATTRVALLTTGRAQIADDLGLADVATITRDPKLEAISVKGLRPYGNAFNVFKEPLRDKRIRQALNYAVNKQSIVDNVLQGFGDVQASVMYPSMIGFTEDVAPYPYDPAKARELLKEAGYPGGLSLEWQITRGVFLGDAEISQAVANQLAEVGVRITLTPLDRARIRSNRAAGLYELIEMMWFPYWDPTGYLNTIFVSANLNDEQMVPKYGSPPDELVAIRKMLADGTAALDPQQKAKIYTELNRFAKDQAFNLAIVSADRIWGAEKAIRWRPLVRTRTIDLFDTWALEGVKAPTGTHVPLAPR
ncbi:MAG: ABC transporter substrate-binding protein [Chloroflexi bacterium]|nr:ABC transporter substrate-binding protein [Chloroflexota bacterium]